MNQQSLSLILTRLRQNRFPTIALDQALLKTRLVFLAELSMVTVWAIWVGRDFLNTDSRVWPLGGDWGLNVQVYFPWTLWSRCGGCVLWNGFANGGAPTFVQLVGAVTHPLVVMLVLVFGPINGTKLTLIAGLIMAGWAQWWIGHVIELGRTARLWTAGMAVVGGHLAGRMDAGLIEEVFSAAACALAIAPALDVALTGRRRSTVLFGLTFGLAMLAGQGYMQAAFILAILPAYLVLLVDWPLRLKSAWQEFVLAGLIAVLVSAVLWFPFLHFWPNFYKPADETFATSQPLGYLLLNLVIDTADYFRAQVLNRFPYPAWYINYIGWVPVILALISLRFVGRAKVRLYLFLLAATVLVYLLSSAVLLQWLSAFLTKFGEVFRTPTVMSSMAVPFILALAGWALDELLKLNWPRLGLITFSEVKFSIDLQWLVLALPLLWALRSAYDFGREWLHIAPMDAKIYEVVQSIKLEGSQWIGIPTGENYYTLAANDLGLKVAETTRPWGWSNRSNPPAHLQLVRGEDNPTLSGYVKYIYGLNMLDQPQNQYAFVDTGERQVPCRADSWGGDIDVTCEADVAGTLIVRENQWTGWTVYQNGEPAQLLKNQWLATPASAGKNHFEFRYRPWDVLLGLVFSLIGVSTTVVLWFSADMKTRLQSQPA